MSNSTEIETTDETIFQAAEVLLREVGDSFTMDQLVNKTKLSRATIYRRVGSKEALVQRMVQERGLEVLATPDVRTRILNAAREAIARYGLLNATIEHIAEVAGVGVATVYRQFGDKERLLQAFVRDMSPRSVVHKILLHPTDDVAADLQAISLVILPFLHQNRDIFQLILSSNSAEQKYFQHLRVGPHRLQDRLTEYFALQIEAGRLQTTEDPKELALAFFGMILSFTVIGPRFYNLPLEEPERIARLISGIFVDGLRR
jgi:AcrR family transcriptional regulator